MPQREPSTPLTEVKNAGPKTISWLHDIGVYTLGDLEDLYKDGFRVYNYSIVGDEEDEHHRHKTKVRVFLKK